MKNLAQPDSHNSRKCKGPAANRRSPFPYLRDQHGRSLHAGVNFNDLVCTLFQLGDVTLSLPSFQADKGQTACRSFMGDSNAGIEEGGRLGPLSIAREVWI